MVDRVGQFLGNYCLESLIGQGESGEVYLGIHIYRNTLVAIKILSIQVAGDDIELFKKQAQIIAHLEHSNIVRVLDFDIHNNIPYLVMDFAQNGNMRNRHPKGESLPADIVVSYVKQIASALEFAHKKNVVHCAVKPENMLIGRNDEILLSDFCIALTGSITHPRPLQSTADIPIYMAPEQVNGNPNSASDQYVLGVLVYEWLCGSPPFHGSSTEPTAQHLTASPPSLQAKNPSISPAIEQVVFKALAKDPEERFDTIQKFAEALEEAVIEDHSVPSSSSLQILATIEQDIIQSVPPQRNSPFFSGPPPAQVSPSPSIDIEDQPTIKLPELNESTLWTLEVPPQRIMSETLPETPNHQINYGVPATTIPFQDPDPLPNVLQDSFILYHRDDRKLAEWIAWQIKTAQFSYILPAWGILRGTDLELELRKAELKARHTILLLSPNFFKALVDNPNWVESLKRDARGQQNRLISIYVDDYRGKHKRHLESINYIELSKQEAAYARKILIDIMSGEYINLTEEPPYPESKLDEPKKKDQKKVIRNKPTHGEPEVRGGNQGNLIGFEATISPDEGIESAFTRKDWRDVIRKVNLLIKRTQGPIPARFHFMKGTAHLEEGEEKAAHESLNDALAEINNVPQRLAMLNDCATLMVSKAMWNEVLTFCKEALKLLPNDPGWLSMKQEAEGQLPKDKGGKKLQPSSPLATSPQLEQTTEIEVFFSYSHRDKNYRVELEKFLSHLKQPSSNRTWQIKGWNHGEIIAGREYARDILKHLSEAQIILLLISHDYIASNYCYDVEMRKAVERHDRGEARVIPIILSPASWEESPIGKLQALPTGLRPLNSKNWSTRADAYMDVARGIQNAINELLKTR